MLVSLFRWTDTPTAGTTGQSVELLDNVRRQLDTSADLGSNY